MKKVIYNGGKRCSYGCSNPDLLKIGKTYEVLFEENIENQTVYNIKDIIGKFNSEWFKEVDTIPTYFAVSNRIPEVGKRCDCIKFEFDGNDTITQGCVTSTVFSVEVIGKDTYKTVTKNSIYLITVM